MERNDVVLNGTDAGEIIIVDCKNFEIKNMDISDTDVGIEIIRGDGMIIQNCSFHNNNYKGMEMGEVFNSHISNCKVYNNGYNGIQLSYGRGNIISECDIYLNSDTGIALSSSYDTLIPRCNIYENTMHGISIVSLSSSNERNNISYCNIYDNEKGVSVFYSSGNVIYNDNISSNNIGISLWGGSKYNLIQICNIHSNHEGVEIRMYIIEIFLIHAHMAMGDMIYQNNFINNDIHAYFFNARQITWDSNYWDDWKGYGRKIIRGNILTLYMPVFPLINFDKNPAKEPW
ncbi:MAG: right-handed parallel beta-helix repeat-containing protein [Thermoplasmata archaeon]|nr:right-handed parallel beta-helix repeat-containing protein [Thermoplasmata archaeon]